MELEIRPLKQTDFGKLVLFLKHSGTHHYQLDPLFRWEKVNEYVANLVYGFSLKEPVLVALENGKITGLLGFRKRNWDTKHFGYLVASIDYFFADKNDGSHAASLLVSKFNEWARENSVKFASIKVFPSNSIVRALEENGFYYVGTEFILGKSLPDPNLNGPTDPGIRFFKKGDTDALLRIAKSASWPGRFHSDPNVNKRKANQLYADWLRNGAKKNNAKVTVLEVSGRPSGFILWSVERLPGRSKMPVGDQELVAVDPKIRGRGYGKTLYRGALKQMQEAGVKLVKTGIAANNAPALNSQAKSGFYFNYSIAIFHRFA